MEQPDWSISYNHSTGGYPADMHACDKQFLWVQPYKASHGLVRQIEYYRCVIVMLETLPTLHPEPKKVKFGPILDLLY